MPEFPAWPRPTRRLLGALALGFASRALHSLARSAPPRPQQAQPAPPRPSPGSAPSAVFKLYKVPLSHLGVSVSPLELGTHRCPQLRVPGKVRSEILQEHICEGGTTENPEREARGPKDHLEGSAGTPASEL